MVLDFIKNLKKKPEFILEVLLPMLSEYDLVGDETVKMAKIYGTGFVKSESFASFVDTFVEYVEGFAKSPTGLRMVQLIPDVMAADNKEAILEIFKKARGPCPP